MDLSGFITLKAANSSLIQIKHLNVHKSTHNKEEFAMTFAEKHAAIKEAAKASNRKTFNETEFNELATAMMNEPDYTVKVATTVKGEYSEKETQPVKALRKAIIGGIMKEAGHDTAEQNKFIESYQFGKLPLYPVVSEVIEQYMDAGKAFALQPKEDMRAVITIEPQEEEVKEVTAPKSNEVTKKRYGAYRKVKVKSTCPSNKKTTVK